MADKQLTGVYLLYSCRGRTCPARNINRKQVLAGKLRAGHARPLRLNNVLSCNNGTRPRNGQDRSLQSTRGPRSVGRGLDPSAAAVCHCDAVGAGHARPATSHRLPSLLPLLTHSPKPPNPATLLPSTPIICARQSPSPQYTPCPNFTLKLCRKNQKNL